MSGDELNRHRRRRRRDLMGNVTNQDYIDSLTADNYYRLTDPDCGHTNPPCGILCDIEILKSRVV